jgi:hypothetical protein
MTPVCRGAIHGSGNLLGVHAGARRPFRHAHQPSNIFATDEESRIEDSSEAGYRGTGMPFTEIVIRGQVRSKHLVQLFDDDQSLVMLVSEFLSAGLVAGDTVLVVSTPDHWNAMACKLEGGVRLTAALEGGQLTVRNAAELLDGFMQDGRPDRGLFNAHVGALVRDLASRATPLRIYGEMVDILAAMGNYHGAQQLEELWNELAERESFTLFCGYCAAHFGDPRHAAALKAICRSHSHVRADFRDALASFLVSEADLLPPDQSSAARR